MIRNRLILSLLAACCVQVASPAGGAGAAEISGNDEKAMADAASGAVVAKAYPDKPVRLIEPFGAGGGPDLLARASVQSSLSCGPKR